MEVTLNVNLEKFQYEVIKVLTEKYYEEERANEYIVE